MDHLEESPQYEVKYPVTGCQSLKVPERQKRTELPLHWPESRTELAGGVLPQDGHSEEHP